MAVRHPYVRPMGGWWRRNPYFLRYMAREATAPFVMAYALVLLSGLIRLAQGREAFEGWLAALRSPGSIAFHGLLGVVLLYHTWSWFRIVPKTLPPLGLRPALITGLGIAASLLASAFLYAGLLWLAR